MPQFEHNKTDVLIAGAGPTGLMTACQLSLFNIHFRIIDKKSSPSNYSGALIIHAKTLELFQQLGLAEKITAHGKRVSAFSTFFNGEKTSRLKLKNFGENLTQFPSMLMLEQAKTEQLLIEFLQKKGIFVEWETKLVDLMQQPDKITAVLKLKNESKITMDASYLIAADGGQSTVRSLLNIPFHGKTHKKTLCIMECKSDIALTDDEIYFAFSEQSTTGFFPLPGRRWRIDAALKNAQNKTRLTFEDVQHDFGKTTKLNVNIYEPDFFSVFHSHGKYAQRFQSRRCFLAGDAAHLYTPVGAQGMNSGLQDAQNLAWKLAFVIQNELKPGILKSYEQERKPLAKRVSKSTSLFFNVVASDAWIYQFFRMKVLKYLLRLFLLSLKKSFFKNFVFKNISGIGISYTENSLTADAGTGFTQGAPKPGERLPCLQYKVDGIKKDVREQVKPTQFHLIIFPKEKETDELLRRTDPLKQIVSVQQIPYSTETESLYRKFGIQSGGWYLVRPDFHIACRSPNLSGQRLENYFNKLMIRE
ncbi:MAG: FAD-dependent monooxygenase [Prolixibacteraceae bacterium]